MKEGTAMTDIATQMTAMRRPRILVRAAKFGLSDYVRDRDLKRMFAPEAPPRPGLAVAPLIAREAEIEAVRQAGSAAYSAVRHVEVLTALIAETRLAAEALN
jgi:hypothetical protein